MSREDLVNIDSTLETSTLDLEETSKTIDLVSSEDEHYVTKGSNNNLPEIKSKRMDPDILVDLTSELMEHKLNPDEEVVEGYGEKEDLVGADGDDKNVESVGEIIEATFSNKTIAESFGSKVESKEEDEASELETELSSSPNKRKVESLSHERVSVLDLSPGETTDVEDNTKENPDYKGLPSKRLRVNELDLPKTVQVLESTISGAKVYLIGTAHFSKESCEDVGLIIQATQPDIVVVELCKARTNILHLDEETILEEAKNLNLEKSLEILKSQGVVQGGMYLLLLSMSAHLTKELGMAPGGEFRRAFLEARAVPGCILQLGDRPIHLTLNRALQALSPWQKLRMAFNILTSKDSITAEEVEKCKDRDLLQNMLQEMAGEFPGLSRVFVDERDVYLAHTLHSAASSVLPHTSSTPATIVGVVGIGHVPGIVQHWGKVSQEQVRSVCKLEPPSILSRVVSGVVRTAAWGSCMYGIYRIARGPVTRLLLTR